MVQAYTPRHGPEGSIPRVARAKGDADLAGSGPRRGSSADWRHRHCSAEGEDPRLGPLSVRAGGSRLGLRVDVPRIGQAGRCKWGTHPFGPPEGLAGESARAAEEGSSEARRTPKGV